MKLNSDARRDTVPFSICDERLRIFFFFFLFLSLSLSRAAASACDMSRLSCSTNRVCEKERRRGGESVCVLSQNKKAANMKMEEGGIVLVCMCVRSASACLLYHPAFRVLYCFSGSNGPQLAVAHWSQAASPT